jgi:hypothetical protein
MRTNPEGKDRRRFCTGPLLNWRYSHTKQEKNQRLFRFNTFYFALLLFQFGSIRFRSPSKITWIRAASCLGMLRVSQSKVKRANSRRLDGPAGVVVRKESPIKKSVCQSWSKCTSSPRRSQPNANCISRCLVVVSSPSTYGIIMRAGSSPCFPRLCSRRDLVPAENFPTNSYYLCRDGANRALRSRAAKL